jgi:hypothetical protein
MGDKGFRVNEVQYQISTIRSSSNNAASYTVLRISRLVQQSRQEERCLYKNTK